jgi:hypothetical protein
MASMKREVRLFRGVRLLYLDPTTIRPARLFPLFCGDFSVKVSSGLFFCEPSYLRRLSAAKVGLVVEMEVDGRTKDHLTNRSRSQCLRRRSGPYLCAADVTLRMTLLPFQRSQLDGSEPRNVSNKAPAFERPAPFVPKAAPSDKENGTDEQTHLCYHHRTRAIDDGWSQILLQQQ